MKSFLITSRDARILSGIRLNVTCPECGEQITRVSHAWAEWMTDESRELKWIRIVHHVSANHSNKCYYEYRHRIPQGYRLFGRHLADLAYTLDGGMSCLWEDIDRDLIISRNSDIYGIPSVVMDIREKLHRSAVSNVSRAPNRAPRDNAKSTIEHVLNLRGRFYILKRDHYRCQICGRTAQDDVALEIDHKVPRSKGGTSDPSNLWVLCFDCNRGKGNCEL